MSPASYISITIRHIYAAYRRTIWIFDWEVFGTNLKFCGVIQLSAIFGCAQVKIFMYNVYTKTRVCTQEK
jgi:hypothetical protein